MQWVRSALQVIGPGQMPSSAAGQGSRLLHVTNVDFEVMATCTTNTRPAASCHASMTSGCRCQPCLHIKAATILSPLQAYYELLQHSLALLPISGGAAAPMITSAISAGVLQHAVKVQQPGQLTADNARIEVSFTRLPRPFTSLTDSAAQDEQLGQQGP